MILIFFAAMLPLLAQGPRGGGRGPGGPGGGRNQVEFLSGYLGLTEAQTTAAKAIFDAANTASTTLRGTLQSAHDALEAGVKAGASDSQIDQLAAAVGAVQGQLEAIRAKSDVKFRALLTADQKTKFDSRGNGPGRP